MNTPLVENNNKITYLTAMTTIDSNINKKYELREGKLHKTPSAQIHSGEAKKVAVNTCEELKAVLDGLTASQAIITGIYDQDTQKIATTKKASPPETLARCKDHIQENDRYWQCIDIDDDIKGVDTTDPKKVADFIRNVLFEYPTMGVYVRPSSSSRVMLNNEPIKAPSWHVWFKCECLTREELKEYTQAFAWLNGHAEFKKQTASNGVISYPVKSPLDFSVFSRERLFFEAAPTVSGEGLTLVMPSEYIDEGDTITTLDLDTSRGEEAAKVKAAARATITPAQQKARKHNHKLIKAAAPAGSASSGELTLNSTREEILTAYGYMPNHNKTAYSCPSSVSKGYSVNLLDDKELISAHSTSDILNQYQDELGKPCLNILETLACLMFDGDIDEATKNLVTEQFDDVEKKPSQESRNKGELYDILKTTKLGEYAQQVATQIEMPKDTAVLCALGIVSAPVSMLYSVAFRGFGSVSTSLYVATEQPPASGKSFILSTFTRPIQKAIKDMNQRATKANNDKEKEEAKIPYYKAFVSDTTPEALEQLLPNNGGHFCVASAEQALVNTLLGISYSDSKKANNNDLILKGYGGEWHSSSRVNRDGYEGYVFGTVTVVAQNGTIDSILEQSNGTGIAERFLMLSEPHMLGYRDHLSKKPQPDIGLAADYSNAIEGLIKSYEGRRESNPISPNLDTLPELSLLDKSWDSIAEQKQELEALMINGGLYSHELLRGVAGKFDQRVMKLAGVLHVFESYIAGEDMPSNTIHPQYVDMAIKIARLSLDHIYKAMVEKDLIGKTAEEEAIYRILTNTTKGIVWRQLSNSARGVHPFKNYPAEGRTDLIRGVCQNMIDKNMLHVEQEVKSNKTIKRFTAI